MQRFVVIAGMGRSGSNRLLDIFDRSAETACRNEANAIPGGHFDLDGELFAEDLTDDIHDDLIAAARAAAGRRCERDRFDMPHKDFLVSGAAPALWLMSKTRLRRALARTGMMKDAGEWRVPPLLLRRDRLAEATTVLKLGNCPAWTVALHDALPGCRIVLNIRAPQDFLNSWYNRFFLRIDRDSFRRALPTTLRILDHFGVDRGARLSRLTDEDIFEIQFWRWRYINETIHCALDGSDRYTIATYDEVEHEGAAAAERLYRFAGLREDPAALEMVSGMRNTLFAKPASKKVDPDLCRHLIDDVLADSPLHAIPGLRI